VSNNQAFILAFLLEYDVILAACWHAALYRGSHTCVDVKACTIHLV
jgi:hypothetical protein